MCVLVVGLFVSGTVNAQRVACNNFAELAVSVVQIRQKESQVQRVLAYERPAVVNSGVQAEAVSFALNQREICNKRYSELGLGKIN
jgi:hypothetical protein